MYQLDRSSDIVKQLIKLDMALARNTMQKAVDQSKKSVTVRTN